MAIRFVTARITIDLNKVNGPELQDLRRMLPELEIEGRFATFDLEDDLQFLGWGGAPHGALATLLEKFFKKNALSTTLLNECWSNGDGKDKPDPTYASWWEGVCEAREKFS